VEDGEGRAQGEKLVISTKKVQLRKRAIPRWRKKTEVTQCPYGTIPKGRVRTNREQTMEWSGVTRGKSGGESKGGGGNREMSKEQ